MIAFKPSQVLLVRHNPSLLSGLENDVRYKLICQIPLNNYPADIPEFNPAVINNLRLNNHCRDSQYYQCYSWPQVKRITCTEILYDYQYTIELG